MTWRCVVCIASASAAANASGGLFLGMEGSGACSGCSFMIQAAGKICHRGKKRCFIFVRGVGKVSFWYLEILERNKSLPWQTQDHFLLVDALAHIVAPS